MDLSGIPRELGSARRILRQEGLARGALMLARRYRRKLGGRALPNTTEANREVWTLHDWSAHGEEWTPSATWKASLVRHLLEPNVPLGSRVLELGPGGGRWTEFLIPRSRELTLVDVTPACIDVCRQRFAGHRHLRFHVNDGRTLPFLADGSIDRVWSYDVFVHIQASDVEQYVRELARVLAPGGVAVIHHARDGAEPGAWRSDMTAAAMREFAARHGLRVREQLESLDEGRVPVHHAEGSAATDVVSILERP